MATHSSILAWKTPWVEEAGGLESMGCKESDMTEQLASIHFTSTVTPGAVGLAGMHLGWDFSPSAALALGPDHSTQWASQVALVVKPPANAQDVKRCRFDPWVGKMPLGRVWQPTPAFSSGECHGQRSLMGYGVAKSQTQLRQLSTRACVLWGGGLCFLKKDTKQYLGPYPLDARGILPSTQAVTSKLTQSSVSPGQLGHPAEMILISSHQAFSSGARGKESARRRCKRRGFGPWAGKMPLEEGMATQASVPAWSIPWTEEPGGLQSMGSQRVRHD